MSGEKSREELRRERYLAEMIADPSDRRHGTITGYGYGCRCSRCKDARRNRDLPMGKKVAV